MSKRLSACGLLGLSGILTCVNALANETQKYTYDDLGRLIEVPAAGTVDDGKAVATGFDPAGNRGSDTCRTLRTRGTSFMLLNSNQDDGSNRDIQRKLKVLRHAVKTDDVAKTCRYFGVGRSSFYR